ncbi:dTMP kinase [Candidatus Xianfuyuplasma coldseepsis]|uniref:Thymidylate kinase n=1 Tax=Candidatus Xianfuyuplasma coldseepsis TaxID=2782163 RepID=A0A7L7KTX1_9MOLU|nr:dTMP kinase [Xianfuyuplasma coldseepsis]QMS85228.1 dTMP kinase [Xianfuyuplasma coldseepsis]
MAGKFITFEGPEGSGKTSVIKAVRDFLVSEGYDIVTTREPGGTKIAEDIRDIILSKENTEMNAHTEALLYAASRSQHFTEVVVPALEKGQIVICDRFIDSSLAYQGYARNLGIDEVFEINRFGIGNKLPDVTIFIDVPPKVGLKRVFDNTGRKVDRLDLESVEFHEKVYQGYLLLADKFKDRFVVVDGTNDVETVVEDTIQILKTYL